MKRIIYRRENISLAVTSGRDIFGCNLWVWYGYHQPDYICNTDSIIDTSEIKQDMLEDMINFDHVCLSLPYKEDYIDRIIDIGIYIFNKAKKHKLLSEVIIEDIYENEIIISNVALQVHAKELINSNKSNTFFLYDNNLDRISLFGEKYQVATFSYYNKWSITKEKRIDKSIFQSMIKKGGYWCVTETDIASGVSITRLAENNQVLYYSVCCVENFSHSLSGFPLSEKCSHLHGHTYSCVITVEKTLNDNFLEQVSLLSKSIHKLFLEAFGKKKIKNTTLENVADYLLNGLSRDFRIVFIKIFETPNIQIRVLNR